MAPTAVPRPGTGPSARRDRRAGPAGVVVPLLGSALVLAALVLLWWLRARANGPVYVSELGADGEPTAAGFEVALLLVVVGGAAVAWSARDLRWRGRTASAVRWPPALTLGVACAAFLLASQVRCSSGCPVPGEPTTTWADLVHTASASIGFAAAAVAMVQTASSDAPRPLARLSVGAAAGVALAAGSGGLLSLLGVAVAAGGFMEHVAMTVGLGWLAALGVGLAAGPAHRW